MQDDMVGLKQKPPETQMKVFRLKDPATAIMFTTLVNYLLKHIPELTGEEREIIDENGNPTKTSEKIPLQQLVEYYEKDLREKMDARRAAMRRDRDDDAHR